MKGIISRDTDGALMIQFHPDTPKLIIDEDGHSRWETDNGWSTLSRHLFEEVKPGEIQKFHWNFSGKPINGLSKQETL